ncbi:MAG: hypothetical protein ACFFAO_13065 [Candidatus Hermodarchaeota archaeon]
MVNFSVIFISVDARAQADFDMDVEEEESFIWEVTDLNKHEFEKTFGFEPAFENGDKTRRTIEDIDDSDDGWYITVEVWDYQRDFDDDGDIQYENVYDSPGDFRDNIFLPTPVDEYLEEASEDLPSEYLVEGLRVTIRETDYNRILEYDSRGILVSEQFENKDGIVIVKVEGTFRIIPIGNFYLGYIALAIAAIVIVMITKKKFIIKDTL